MQDASLITARHDEYVCSGWLLRRGAVYHGADGARPPTAVRRRM